MGRLLCSHRSVLLPGETKFQDPGELPSKQSVPPRARQSWGLEGTSLGLHVPAWKAERFKEAWSRALPHGSVAFRLPWGWH